MPATQPSYADKFECISSCFSGVIITPVMNSQHMKVKNIANFGFNPFLWYRGSNILRNIIHCLKTITKALRLHYFGKGYDVVISPNPHLSGLIAVIIGFFTGTKVVVEVQGNFEEAFRYEKAGSMGLEERIKESFGRKIIPFVLKKADMIKLLYERQIDPLNIKGIEHVLCRNFPDFTPVSRFKGADIRDEKYILLLGHPWYLKGVDLLIKAFHKVSRDFPEYRLKVVGWCPEGRQYFEDLAENDCRIELRGPVYYDEVVTLMSGCSLYVLASRTEAMGRVLIEAMACSKPIVASGVGGVPSIIKNGYNGVLFKSQDIDDLAQKIRMVLSDADLARRLGENGYKYMNEFLSEECFVENYRRAIGEIVGNPEISTDGISKAFEGDCHKI